MRHPESRGYRCPVKMAASEPRRALVWDIHKKLPSLSASELLELAIAVDDGEGQQDQDLSALSEPELFYFITDFVKSDQLKELEDEGLSRLLFLNDIIDRLLTGKNDSQSAGGDATTTPPHIPDHQTATVTTDNPLANHGHRTKLTRDPATRDRESVHSSVSEQVVRFTDVAAYLPRREFKVHGGQISDSSSDITYNSIGKQIDEGIKEGFTESEIIRTVLKIIKPGTFKEMLTNKDDLTVAELKRFLRSHLRDKSSTELFQELSNAKQQDKETAQQFVYRIMGLKQRVLFASQQGSAEFSYDKNLVQGVFLHTLYQGLSEKNRNIRCDIKPYLSDSRVTDDFIIEQVTKSASEEAERLKRLGPPIIRLKPVTVNSTLQADGEDSEDLQPTHVDSEVQANRTAIMQLTAQVSALTKNLQKMVKPTESETSKAACPPPTSISSRRTDTRGKCQECVQKGNENCPHCFRCGQAGHRAIGCLKKLSSGNGVRSPGRDNQ